MSVWRTKNFEVNNLPRDRLSVDRPKDVVMLFCCSQHISAFAQQNIMIDDSDSTDNPQGVAHISCLLCSLILWALKYTLTIKCIFASNEALR